MKAKKKTAAKKRLRSSATGLYTKGGPAHETVRETAPKAIMSGWIEVDDDGVPNGDPASGNLTVHKEEPNKWNTQYVRVVPARPPRGRRK